MRVRKKPVIVEAVRYDGTNGDELIRWAHYGGNPFQNMTVRPGPYGVHLVIVTLEGDMHANVGDWIIKGMDGEFYPCKPDIFEATYEILNEEDAE